MNAFVVPPTETCVKMPPAFVDRNRPWFVATSSVSAAGIDDEVHAAAVERRAPARERPRVARVDRAVDADGLEESVVVEVAGARVDDRRVRRIERERADRKRRHVVRLRRPVVAAVGRLPDAAVVERGVDDLVGRVPRIDRDADDLTGVGALALVVLLRVDDQRRRSDLRPLDADDSAAAGRRRARGARRLEAGLRGQRAGRRRYSCPRTPSSPCGRDRDAACRCRRCGGCSRSRAAASSRALPP